MIGWLIAALACLIWVYLLAARGGFWRAAQRDDPPPRAAAPPPRWPRVTAVIPARDEATFIGEAVASLLRQDYGGALCIVIVDDHSGDATAAVAAQAARDAAATDRVQVLSAPGLPEGWTGKTWALQQGVAHAGRQSEAPEYLLFTDADIRYADDTLALLVRRALDEGLVLASLMAKLHCRSFAERALIPAFIFFFQMLYPFAWVNRREHPTAAAAGGCMLVQRQALQAAGGLEAIRAELIDDCALAGLLKRRGPIGLGLTERVVSVRVNASFADMRRMVARCAYAQLRYSPWRLAAVTAAMLVTYLAAPALVVFGGGVPQLLGALAWAQMAWAFQPTLRLYRASPAWGLALPAIAAIYLLFTFDSAYQHLRGRGGAWKGRVYRPGAGREAPRRGG